MKCKPKDHGMLLTITSYRVTIILKPQQIWEYRYHSDDEAYEVARDNVTIKLTATDFNNYFVKLGGKL